MLLIRNTVVDDYPEIRRLWAEYGVVSKDDSRGNTESFLSRNGKYCFTAESDGRIIGSVMCGCDGRSARIYHLAVDPEFRRSGVAHSLVQSS